MHHAFFFALAAASAFALHVRPVGFAMVCVAAVFAAGGMWREKLSRSDS